MAPWQALTAAFPAHPGQSFKFGDDQPRFGALSLVRMPVLTLALAMATDNPLAQAALSGDLGVTALLGLIEIGDL